jgi:quercetin dioxygenase-like cupin family protein
MMGCTSPKHGGKVEAIELVKSSTSWNGQPLPPYKTGTPEVTILRITIPPKTTLPLHTHPVINAGVLLKGELTVTTDTGQVLHLKPYDPIVEVVDTLHHGNNDGDEPAEIIVFYAGEQGDAVTVIAPEEE